MMSTEGSGENGRARQEKKAAPAPAAPGMEIGAGFEALVPDATVARQALGAPGPLAPRDVIALQRTVGNGAVQRLLDGRRAPPASPPPVTHTLPPTLARLQQKPQAPAPAAIQRAPTTRPATPPLSS